MKNINDKIIQLIKDGLSYKEVSDIVNKTPNSIRGICFRQGVKSSDYVRDKTIKCLECEKEIKKKWKDNKFCSKSCSATFNNKLKSYKKGNKRCANCDMELSRTSNKYCSQKCQNEFEYDKYIDKWKKGEVDGNRGKYRDSLSAYVRKYIFIKYDSKCNKCGWCEVNEYTGNIPLEIDHIDGNHLNSVEENLMLLCPSCHSLTEFYGSRNKGRGREYRREYRKKNKK